MRLLLAAHKNQARKGLRISGQIWPVMPNIFRGLRLINQSITVLVYVQYLGYCSGHFSDLDIWASILQYSSLIEEDRLKEVDLANRLNG